MDIEKHSYDHCFLYIQTTGSETQDNLYWWVWHNIGQEERPNDIELLKGMSSCC